MNITSILYKLKFEQTISDSERNFVKRKLFNYKSDDELNQAIRAFGFAYPRSAENIKIIENFLQYKAKELKTRVYANKNSTVTCCFLSF